MTTDDIVTGLDRSLALLGAERDRLLAARAELAGTSGDEKAVADPRSAVALTGRRRRASSTNTKRRPGETVDTVLGALDPTKPRTAGEIAKMTKVGRTLVASTISRLVQQGKASKAQRGYLQAQG